MSKYVFILGHNPELSTAEIMAVVPSATEVLRRDAFLVIETSESIDAPALMNQLGGTIKIGEVINDKIDRTQLAKFLQSKAGTSKLNFGLSYYNQPKDILGMQLKGDLKEAGVSARLVVSREDTLSSVVVTKNKCTEIMLLAKQFVAVTLAVQDFEEYGFLDFGRPQRDMVSGSMPPKLAKIMLNLSGAKVDQAILDPFCGSGTMIQQALLLGFTNILGSDASPKAVEDTKKNLNWLGSKLNLKSQISNVKVIQCDVRELAKRLKQTMVDAVVTEPYLGPPLKGNEMPIRIEQIVTELSELYVGAFKNFARMVNPGGKVVMVFPVIIKRDSEHPLPIIERVEKLGFKELSGNALRYGRTGQKVARQIMIFEKV